MDGINAAIYLRISNEDSEDLLESGSISSQREIIKEYIKNHSDFSGAKFTEFCDDGYSGTNFERPGFKKLFKELSAGRINCILVKDLSRLGRNYIEVGNYLEQIFPFFGVRVISVNDCFDSLDSGGEFMGAAFKNLVYDLYSKDLSAKITSIRRLKAGEGKFLTAYAPYGYKKSPDNELVIDEDPAKVIRRIFSLALSGVPRLQIARTLNEEGVLSPLMLRRLRKEKFPCRYINDKCLWSAPAVLAILKDQRYIGDSVYGKLKPAGVGSKKNIPVPENKWIIVKNTHEPIVSPEEFENINGQLKKRKNYRRKEKSPLAGLIKCDVCKHTMSRAKHTIKGEEKAFYRCRTKSISDEYLCFSEAIEEKKIEQAVVSVLNALYAVIFNAKTKEDKLQANGNKALKLKRLIYSYESGIRRLKVQKKRKYELYKSDGLFREDFLSGKEETDKAINSLTDKLKSTKEEFYSIKHSLDNGSQMPFKLTNESARIFIKQIFITSNGELKIEWNFGDIF